MRLYLITHSQVVATNLEQDKFSYKYYNSKSRIC